MTQMADISYSPLIDRPHIQWPNGAKVAFWLALNVEFYEYVPTPNAFSSIYSRGVPAPDTLVHSMLEYGNRVGFWRTLRVLDDHDVPVSADVSLSLFEHCPEVTDAMQQRDWSLYSHGLNNTEFLYGHSEDWEREWIERNKSIFLEHTGKSLTGMFGPVISQSPHSMKVWESAGIQYVVDWFMDDQPFGIDVGAGLVNVPYSFDLNDGLYMGSMPNRGGRWEGDQFLESCIEQLDQLHAEGDQGGRVMCVALHPFVIGQPARITYLDKLLTYVQDKQGVWLTTADRIATHYRQNYLAAAQSWQLQEGMDIRP